jgi:hypothetical protein
MAIFVNSVIPNQTVAKAGIQIFSGIVEFVFKGPANGGIARDTLAFTVARINLGTGIFTASCTISPASFAYDGAVNDALWAVDNVAAITFVNEDRGTGTGDLQVVANLAVRGKNGLILRVNYILFYVT